MIDDSCFFLHLGIWGWGLWELDGYAHLNGLGSLE